MAIDYSKLRSVTARQWVSALERDGFYLRFKSKSAHRQYRHEDGRRVTVSYHGHKATFPVGTLKAMVAQAQWTVDDLKRLKLLK